VTIEEQLMRAYELMLAQGEKPQIRYVSHAEWEQMKQDMRDGGMSDEQIEAEIQASIEAQIGRKARGGT
jgi:hypothetical protein